MNLFEKQFFYFNLGLRNIVKYKRKSLQVVVITFLGAVVMSLISGFTDGMFKKFLNDMLEETAHGKIYYKEYYKKQEISPLELVIKNYSEIKSEISRIETKIKIFPSLKNGVVLTKEDSSVNIFCQGIVPFDDNGEMFSSFKVYEKKIVKGKFLTSNKDKGLLISSFVATDLGCDVGDKIIIFSGDSFGSFNAIELEVVGIFNTGNRIKDESICFVDLYSMQKLLSLENGVTEISLFFDDYKHSESFREKISSVLEKYNLEYYSWKELLGFMLQAINMGKIFYVIIYVIFLVVAAVGIMNTVLISMFDRIRDIGTLRAIGFSKNDISFIVIIEMFIVGLIGATTGILIGGAILYYFSLYGIVIPESTKDVVSWLADNRIYPLFSLSYLILPFIISLLVPVFSSFYPLSVVRKIKIKTALGYL
ncbi:MAG: FtsX-like permease family protein [Endomicrobiia bacterium]